MGLSNEKLGEVEATFEVMPIVVKGEPLGNLLRMTYKPR
jgi:hypothetical protein